MLKETIAKIETAIRKMKAENTAEKAKLERLLSELKREIEKMPGAHPRRAKSIAAELSASVKGFELSHPELVETVNEVCLLLSKIGI